MEVIDMLDEEEYLRFSPDYTDWNEEAGSPDELVLDYITLKKRSDQLEEMAEWAAAELDFPEEKPEEEQKKENLKEAVLDEGLRRIEYGDPTVKAIEKQMKEYDKKVENRERTIRANELPRGDLPWEFEMSVLPKLFPAWMNLPVEKSLQHGDFIDALYDCPYELKELIAKAFYSQQFDALTVDQKMVAYFYFLREWKTKPIAEMKGVSLRAIRKIKTALERKLQKKAFAYLQKRTGRTDLTNIERFFLEEYADAMLQTNFSGGISRTLKRHLPKTQTNVIKVKKHPPPPPSRPDVDEKNVWQYDSDYDSENLICVKTKKDGLVI